MPLTQPLLEPFGAQRVFRRRGKAADRKALAKRLLSHLFGNRRYETTDRSRNNPWLAIITLGEGWHNNHHHYQNATRQGFFWWEFDVSYYIIRTLGIFGVVWDIKEPPKELLAKKYRTPKNLAPISNEPSGKT